MSRYGPDATTRTNRTQVVELSEEQMEEFKEAFVLFDQSGDGMISVKEMQLIMRSIGQNPSEAEILDLMKELDPDSDGETDFNGFIKLMQRQLADEELNEELYEAFKTFDKSQKGSFNVVEMREFMEKYGEKLPDEEYEKLFKDIDTDDDGLVNFDDFVLLMMAK